MIVGRVVMQEPLPNIDYGLRLVNGKELWSWPTEAGVRHACTDHCPGARVLRRVRTLTVTDLGLLCDDEEEGGK